MARAFCPKCGNFTFGYDPEARIHRCYSVKCRFVDKAKEYGEGLSQNPFTKRDSSGLRILTTAEQVSRT